MNLQTRRRGKVTPVSTALDATGWRTQRKIRHRLAVLRHDEDVTGRGDVSVLRHQPPDLLQVARGSPPSHSGGSFDDADISVDMDGGAEPGRQRLDEAKGRLCRFPMLEQGDAGVSPRGSPLRSDWKHVYSVQDQGSRLPGEGTSGDERAGIP